MCGLIYMTHPLKNIKLWFCPTQYRETISFSIYFITSYSYLVTYAWDFAATTEACARRACALQQKLLHEKPVNHMEAPIYCK